MKPRTSGSSSMIGRAQGGRLRRLHHLFAASRDFRAGFRRLAKQQADRRALAGRAPDARRAAGLARHAVDHRQAQAGALADLLGGEEGLERALGDFGGHAEAGVADGQLDIVAVRDLGVVLHLHRPGREGQHSAFGHGVAGIDREIEDCDLELGRVGHHRH